MFGSEVLYGFQVAIAVLAKSQKKLKVKLLIFGGVLVKLWFFETRFRV